MCLFGEGGVWRDEFECILYPISMSLKLNHGRLLITCICDVMLSYIRKVQNPNDVLPRTRLMMLYCFLVIFFAAC